MDNNTRHKWTEKELKGNNEECIKILQLIFTDCSIFSIKMIVDRYNTLCNNQSGWNRKRLA